MISSANPDFKRGGVPAIDPPPLRGGSLENRPPPGVGNRQILRRIGRSIGEFRIRYRPNSWGVARTDAPHNVPRRGRVMHGSPACRRATQGIALAGRVLHMCCTCAGSRPRGTFCSVSARTDAPLKVPRGPRRPAGSRPGRVCVPAGWPSLLTPLKVSCGRPDIRDPPPPLDRLRSSQPPLRRFRPRGQGFWSASLLRLLSATTQRFETAGKFT